LTRALGLGLRLDPRESLQDLLPKDAILPDDRQDAMRVQLFNAEKDLAHALELARKNGFALPTAALVSQGMARIYRVEDRGRR
jgi:hypothetical protein